MTYTVVWKPRPMSRLAEIWTEAPNRESVRSAADAIDALLRNDPQTRGESRSGSTRILVSSPLVVSYDIREEDRIVEVLAVRYLPSRPG